MPRGHARPAFLACLAIWLTSTPLGAAPPSLSAGVAKTKVTPPLDIPYLASSGGGTNEPFKGFHDDLFARALVLDDGSQPLALLAVDSIGYDNALLGPGRDFTRELRRRIAAKTGVPAGAVMLAASHAHATPETIDLSPVRDTPGVAEWLERHLDQLADTVISAWEHRTPVRCFAGSIEAPGLQRYRRIALKGGGESRNGPIPSASEIATPYDMDERLYVLYLETMDGRPHGVVLNYTAHPIVAMDIPEVSADFPGAATAYVERALNGATCLFTNGFAGNMNSIDVCTGFKDVDKIGNQLGKSALECVTRLKAGPALSDTRLAVRSETCTLASRPTPTVAEATRAVEANSSADTRATLRLAQKLALGPIEAEVQAMSIGPVRWVSLPGEPFVETGLALKRAGAAFVVGYANGYIGYVPIRRAYAEGGYEVIPGKVSRVAPGSAERLQTIGEGLLGRTPGSRSGGSAQE